MAKITILSNPLPYIQLYNNTIPLYIPTSNMLVMAMHNKLGNEGEKFARSYLQTLGYKILHTNWHYVHKEIDLIALYNNTLLIIEVKTRTNSGWENPRNAITNAKIRFLADAAEAYIYKYNRSEEVRFDVLTLIGDSAPFEVEYIPGAFVPGL